MEYLAAHHHAAGFEDFDVQKVRICCIAPGKNLERARDGLLMLILDVKTRWSSTHQMLRKYLLYRYCCQLMPFIGWFLDFRSVINVHVAASDDLAQYRISTAEWDAITLVTGWLNGLQEDVKHDLCDLPNSTPASLTAGLMGAHRKLSDYYFKSDVSPYYTWASRTFLLHSRMLLN